MNSILKFSAASLAFAGLAAVATPAMAGPGHVDLRVETGYYPAPAYVQPRVIYEAPAPDYRYQDREAWREHVWRERERHKQYWRERNEWREHAWGEHQRWAYGDYLNHR